jgi:hypothetical protein
MIAWLAVLLGGLVLMLGWALLQPETEEDRRKRLGGPERIELRGRVVSDERSAPLIAPFSKREVVWLRVDVDEVQRSPLGAWDVRVHVHDDTRCVPFCLEDAAGVRTRIALDGAQVSVPRQQVMNQTVVQAAPPEALAYLAATNISPIDRADLGKKMWFYERAIRVGDELLVIGRAAPDSARIERYRTSDPRFDLAAGLGPEHDLVVTKTTDARLLATVRPFRSLGWSMAIVGAASVLLGLLAFFRGS